MKKDFLTFDIATKFADSQREGFSRPFMTAVTDGINIRDFVNAESLRKKPWRQRAYEKGGCIDHLMSWMLSSRHKGFSVYGSSFSILLLLPWFKANMDRCGWHIHVFPETSQIQSVEVKAYKKNVPIKIYDERDFVVPADRGYLPFFDGGMPEKDERWVRYLRQDVQLQHWNLERQFERKK